MSYEEERDKKIIEDFVNAANKACNLAFGDDKLRAFDELFSQTSKMPLTCGYSLYDRKIGDKHVRMYTFEGWGAKIAIVAIIGNIALREREFIVMSELDWK